MSGLGWPGPVGGTRVGADVGPTARTGAVPPEPTRVMGILNVTPDSFSDGGRWVDPERAVAHGLRQWAEGAALVDVGGESTRPGAERVGEDVELARVLPVVRRLAEEGVAVSVDTMRAPVARACVEAGAVLVNDVSGGLADPEMLACVAALGVDYVAMHWRGHSAEMAARAHYADVVGDVRRELADRVAACVAAGIAPGRVLLDPGIGFAKTADQSWALLHDLSPVLSLGHRVLVGVSRKSFLGSLLAPPGGPGRPVQEREDAGVALTALLARQGVWGVRTHTVARHVDAARVAARVALG